MPLAGRSSSVKHGGGVKRIVFILGELGCGLGKGVKLGIGAQSISNIISRSSRKVL